MGGKDKETSSSSKEGEKEVFQIPWMKECYNGLTYPDPECVQVMDKVSKALANRVTQPQGSELKQQALFSLLGPEFTDQHFPYHKYNVKILDTPKINPKMKEKYVQEMREFLNKALDLAMKDCHYPDDLNGYKEDNEMGHYLQKIRSTFKEGLKKHTAQVLAKEEKEREDKKKEKKKKRSSDSSSDEEEEDKAKTKLGLNSATKPSDICSEALLAIIAHDASKKDTYMTQIKKRHLGLSIPLRQHFWLDYLKERERKHLKLRGNEDAMLTIEKNFSKYLTKEMKAQKLRRAIRSDSWKIIDNTVIETYDNTSSLRLLDTDEHMFQSVKVLNIHTVYSRSYSVHYINWLMPFQLAYMQKPEDKEEPHVMKLSMYLEMALRHCRPSMTNVFSIAEDIVDTIKVYDRDYHQHIEKCLSNQVSRINVKDFPPEVLLKDQKDSIKLHEELQKNGSNSMNERDQDIFTDVTIFVRMWLIQGYAGVVSVPSTLWLWDELFLNKWSKKYLHDVGVAILSLIKPWMMRANMYSGARKVLLDEPGKIYLSDLRKSMIHLQGGGEYKEIPENKNYLPPKPGKEPKPDGGKKSATKQKTKKQEKPPSAKPTKQKNPQGSGATSVVLPFAADRLFQVDLSLLSDSDDDSDSDYETKPLPEPEPDTETESESEPELDPTPPPTPPPPTPPPRTPSPQSTPTPPPTPPPPKTDEDLAWVPYDKQNTSKLPAGTRVSEPCDLYIDYVRFLPDDITHCKITGKIINMYLSKDENVPDIIAYPEMDSRTRTPSFRYKLCLNRDKDGERQFLNPEMIIILRVYGYDNRKKEVLVVGSCLVRVFRSELKPPKLCVGGWQIRVRHGLPNPPGGLDDLTYTDMNENTPIPGVTICVRLLPSSQGYVPAPEYESQYYRNEGTRPTDSEKMLYRHYVRMDGYKTKFIRSHLEDMLKLDDKYEYLDGEELQSYMESTLDQKAQQKKTKAQVPNVDYNHFINYCIKVGIKAKVLGIFGLPVYYEGRVCQVYCEVLPGRDTLYESRTADGHGGYERFLTKKLDFLSSQRSPQWLDEETILHPHYDEKAVLLIRVFGFEPRYSPGDGSYPGALKDAKSSYISFKYDSPMAWSVVQLFERNSVVSGVYWLPLLKGSPNPKVLEMLQKASPAHKVLLLANKKDLIKFHEGASIEIKLWDGHMGPDALRDGRNEVQIDDTKSVEKYVKMHKSIFNKSIDEFVLENMDSNIKKDGPIGERFEKEREFFEDELTYHFEKAMNDALRAADKEPLPESS